MLVTSGAFLRPTYRWFGSPSTVVAVLPPISQHATPAHPGCDGLLCVVARRPALDVCVSENAHDTTLETFWGKCQNPLVRTRYAACTYGQVMTAAIGGAGKGFDEVIADEYAGKKRSGGSFLASSGGSCAR